MNETPSSATPLYPLSVQQARVWRLHEEQRAGVAFVASGEWRLSGELEPQRFQAALLGATQPHLILRTRWYDTSDRALPVQGYPSDSAPAVGFRDWSHIQPDNTGNALKELLGELAAEAGKRDTASVLQAQLIRLGANEYSFLLCLPAACADAATLRKIVNDTLSAYYTALPLESQVQYGQYSAWQNECLNSTEAGWETDYWRSKLQQADFGFRLPYETDAQRSGINMRSIARTSFDNATVSTLRALAAQLQVSPDAILATSWSLLIGRLIGCERVTLGFAVDGRRFDELRGVPGPLTRFVPLLCDLQADYQFTEALQRVMTNAVAAIDAQDHFGGAGIGQPDAYPFAFEYQKAVAANDFPSALKIQEQRCLAISECFSAKLTCVDYGTGIDFWFDYDCERLSSDALQLLSSQFVELLRGSLETPHTQLVGLNILGERERHRLLYEQNNTTFDLGPFQAAHARFESQAARTPDAVAVRYDDRAITYAELDGRANQLAHYLLRHGAGRDKLVAVCIDRIPELLVAILGVLKAGAAYLPIEPNYPIKRRDFLLAAAQAEILLADASVLQTWQPEHIVKIALDTEWKRLEPESRVATGVEILPDDLAYVIFTSGSTGEPKGVMVEHLGFANYLHWCQLAYPLTPGQEVPVHSSIAFDLTITSLIAPLTTGAIVRMLPDALGLPGLVNSIRPEATVGLIKITPAHVQWLGSQLANRSNVNVKALVIGGENLLPEHINAWRERHPDTRIFNEYGPTETVVGCCVHEILPGDILGNRPLPIGRPIINTRLYVLDERLEPVATGITGELYIGGVGVARGYIGQATLSAERFLTDPFAPAPAEARMYKTGDLARHMPDGRLELIGRADHQIKIRGYRIEPGEIEAVLTRQPGIDAAVVLGHGDSTEERRLIAYIVASDIAVDALRETLRGELPAHMVPSQFVRIDHLPLNSNGKVERKDLPAPGQMRSSARHYEEPKGSYEHLLAALWKELLNVERVGRHDSFFELGGHSFLLITVLERLRSQQLEVSVREAFGASNLAELAARIKPADNRSQKQVLPHVPDGRTAIGPEMVPLSGLAQHQIDNICASLPGGHLNVQDIYRLTPLQEGMIFHHRIQDGPDPYVARALFECSRNDGRDQFIEAIEHVICRHDALRTGYFWEGLEHPVQVVVRDSGKIQVELLDLSDCKNPRQRFSELTDPALHKMDVRRPPLIKICVAAAADQTWHLALLFHHLACDHVSLEILVTEIGTILENRTHLLPPPRPYRNFIATLQDVVGTEDHRESYFRTQFGDVTWSTAPFGVREIRGDGTDITEHHADLDPVLARRVRLASRNRSVTPAVLFHAVWALVLARCCCHDDVVFGTLLSGRSASCRTEMAIGMFINTLPLRVRLAGHSADELVAAIARSLGELLEHEQANLALAQRCSAIEGGGPLFTSLLNYRHSSNAAAERSAGLEAAGLRLIGGEERNSYPLTFTVDDFSTGFSVKAQCTAEVDPELIISMVLEGLDALLRSLESAPDTPAIALDVFSATSYRHGLVALEGPSRSLSPNKLVHEMFEEQAAARPSAIALVHNGSESTYLELDCKAELIARALEELGVNPDDRVALCVSRGSDMVAGLLGVMKSGGAYVPLDPGFPAQHLAYMFKDSEPKALLTERSLLPALEAWDIGSVPILLLDDLKCNTTVLKTRAPSRPSLRQHAPDRLAYVLYTSGSSGRPKGVMVEHRALANFNQAMTHTLGIACSDVVLACTTLSFDIAALEIFLPLSNGATVAIGERADATDPARLDAAIKQRGVTLLQATPSSWQMLLDSGWQGHRGLRALCGGEALSANLARRLAQRCGELYNVYGPTETTIWSTWRRIDENNLHHEGYESIGTPIDNTQVYVLDQQLRLVPPGAAGELCIAGAGVARGYLNRPELDAERFVPNPFGGDDNSRLYRTGDIVRQDIDGNLHYVGRNDHQLKIRGHRIELGEIEARLNGHPSVIRSIVLPQSSASGITQLIAYFIKSKDLPTSAGALREYLLACLPEYMVPAAFVELQSFPLTPNGKLDRSTLPPPDESAFVTVRFEAPTNDIEIELARLWEDLLGIARVGRQDHFFDLGGHSLLATQLIMRVEISHGVAIPLKYIFEKPVLSDFAAVILEHQMKVFSESELKSMKEELNSLTREELLHLLNTNEAGE